VSGDRKSKKIPKFKKLGDISPMKSNYKIWNLLRRQ